MTKNSKCKKLFINIFRVIKYLTLQHSYRYALKQSLFEFGAKIFKYIILASCTYYFISIKAKKIAKHA